MKIVLITNMPFRLHQTNHSWCETNPRTVRSMNDLKIYTIYTTFQKWESWCIFKNFFFYIRFVKTKY